MLNTSNNLNLSLVAFYGQKDLLLQRLISDLQQQLQNYLADYFVPYEIEQVHATIIGCEGIKTQSGIINKWFYKLRNEVRYIDYTGLVNYFCSSKALPLQIYFGGYKSTKDYQYISKNQHPCDRSFQLQKSVDNSFIPILIGWSQKAQIISTDIEQIRRELQQFNCLHKYHKTLQDTDNDLYLRIGTVAANCPLDLILAAQQEIISYLQDTSPIIISLKLDNLAIVQYQKLSLPISTTKVCYLTDLKSNLEKLQKLYR